MKKPAQQSPINFENFETVWNLSYAYKIVGRADGHSRWAMYLRSLIIAGRTNEMTIKRSSEWPWMAEHLKATDHWYAITMDDISTYQDCVSAKVTAILTEDGKKAFKVEIDIWNGDNFSGCRETKRCTITVNVYKMSKLLTESMQPYIVRYSVDLLEEQEEMERLTRLYAIQQQLVASTIQHSYDSTEE